MMMRLEKEEREKKQAYTVISRDERTVSLIVSATEDMTNRTRI